MNSIVFSLALSALKASFKNPASVAKFKTTLLEIRDAISALFPGE